MLNEPISHHYHFTPSLVNVKRLELGAVPRNMPYLRVPVKVISYILAHANRANRI